jgi:NAD(P)-dependent dehydrogenase (short-subunit alcohol dehydrogenase family)
MDLGLPDRVYLVTGGSRGLGFAAAQALIAKGARVVLSAPHEATASAAAARLTQNPAAAGIVTWVVADNADPAPQSPGRACRDAEAPSRRWQHATDDEGVRELPPLLRPLNTLSCRRSDLADAFTVCGRSTARSAVASRAL